MQRWLASRAPGTLAISDWVITEFSSAQALKLRTGQIEPEHRADAMAAFARLVEQSLLVLPITGVNFRDAARLADLQGLSLRAGDALHLAVCAQHGARMVTLDSRLAGAAIVIGVPIITIDAMA